MNGIQQGMLAASRELGAFSDRVLGSGGQQLGGWDIAWTVLGLLLWAAAMAALVMGIIALVRYLKKPKEAAPAVETPVEDETKEDEPATS